MQIALSKTSDVSLRQQLAEQIVLLITTGQLRAGERVDQRDEGAAPVAPTGLGRREVEAAERAVLRGGQRLDGAAGQGDVGQRKALRVDELDSAGSRRLTRPGKRPTRRCASA